MSYRQNLVNKNALNPSFAVESRCPERSRGAVPRRVEGESSMRKTLCEISLQKAQGYPVRYLEHFWKLRSIPPGRGLLSFHSRKIVSTTPLPRLLNRSHYSACTCRSLETILPFCRTSSRYNPFPRGKLKLRYSFPSHFLSVLPAASNTSAERLPTLQF